MLEREQRSARHHGLARRPAACDQGACGIPLGNHRADEHDLGPGQIPLTQLPHVYIHQPLHPGLRQHRGHGQQAQRRQRGALVDELQGMLETPERVRKLGVHQENLHIVIPFRVQPAVKVTGCTDL